MNDNEFGTLEMVEHLIDGYTVAEVAGQVGVSRSTIYRVLDSKPASQATQVKIKAAFDDAVADEDKGWNSSCW